MKICGMQMSLIWLLFAFAERLFWTQDWKYWGYFLISQAWLIAYYVVEANKEPK